MDATTLARWTAFAEDGGIGHAVSIRDHLAAEDGQLMFLAGEPIVVLAKLGVEGDLGGSSSGVKEELGMYLGYCEEVVGLFRATDVEFAGPLSTPDRDTRKYKPRSPTSTISLSSTSFSLSSPTPSIQRDEQNRNRHPHDPAHPTSPEINISRTQKGRAGVHVDQTITAFSHQAEGGFTTPSPGQASSARGAGSRLESGYDGRMEQASPTMQRMGSSVMRISPMSQSGTHAAAVSDAKLPSRMAKSDVTIGGRYEETDLDSPTIGSFDPSSPHPHLHSHPTSHAQTHGSPNQQGSPALSFHYHHGFAARASQRASNPFELDFESGACGSGSGSGSVSGGGSESGASIPRSAGFEGGRDSGLTGGGTGHVVRDRAGEAAAGHSRDAGSSAPVDITAYDRRDTHLLNRNAPHHSPDEGLEHLNEAPVHRTAPGKQGTSRTSTSPSITSRVSMMSLNSEGRSQGSDWGGLGWMIAKPNNDRAFPGSHSVASGGVLSPSNVGGRSGQREEDTVNKRHDSTEASDESDNSFEENFEMIEADAFPSPTPSERLRGSPVEIGKGSPAIGDVESASPPQPSEVTSPTRMRSPGMEAGSESVRTSPMANSWTTRNTGESPISRDRLMPLKVARTMEPIRGLFGPVASSPLATTSDESTGATLYAYGDSPPNSSMSGHRDQSSDSQHTLWLPGPRNRPAILSSGHGYPPVSLAKSPAPLFSKPEMPSAPSDHSRESHGSPATRQHAMQPGKKQTSPGGTSVSISAMARHHSGSTLVGATSIDLTSASNPVPISFILGDHHSPRPYHPPAWDEVEIAQIQQSPPDPSRTRPVPAVAQGLLPTHESPGIGGNASPPQTMIGPFPAKTTLGERRRSRSFSQVENGETGATILSNIGTKPVSHGSLADRYQGFMSGPVSDSSVAVRPRRPRRAMQVHAPEDQNRPRSRSLHRPDRRDTPNIVQEKPSLPQLRVNTANLTSLPPIPTLSPFLPASVIRTEGQPSSSPGGRSLSSMASGSSDSLGRRKKMSTLTKDSPLGRPSLSKGPMSAVSNKDYTDVSLDGADFSFTVEPPAGGVAFSAEVAGFPDEWGFMGATSPVPGIFALSAGAARDTSKIEQALLLLLQKPCTATASKKLAKQITDKHLPPSLRTKVYAWLQSSHSPRAPLHSDFITLAEQLGANDSSTSSARSPPPAWSKFHSHRAFAAGMQDVQHILAVFAYRHPKQGRADFDLSWIAALFLMNSFDSNEAYRLFEAFVEEHHSAMVGRALALDTAVIEELLRSTDIQLSKHLALEGVSIEFVFQAWSHSLFAGALPYPSAVRTLDLVMATGMIYLVRTALAVLALMSKRIQSIQTKAAITDYLLNLPPDALLSPESISKAAQKVSEEGIRKCRQRVTNQGR